MHSEGKTMENKLVSIIVPVYNVETYLKRCITSLLAQSYTNTEIILVDDGSTDASGKICDHYAASHPSLICLHQTNQGQSCARNAGMRIAHGDYYMFVDSDDYIEPDFTERLVTAAETNNADLVIAPYWMVIPLASSKSGRRTEKLLAQLGVQTDTAEPEVSVYSFLPAGNYGQKEFMQEYMKKPSSFYFNVVWNKLYRRAVFAQLRYPEGKLNEDLFLIPEVCLQIQKAVVVPKELYYYVKFV